MNNHNYEDVLAIISDISPLDTLFFTEMHKEMVRVAGESEKKQETLDFSQ